MPRKIHENWLKAMHSRKGVKFSADHKIKIGAANRGKVRTAEMRVNMSLASKGRKAWNKGIKMSDEFKEKCRIGQLNSTVKLRGKAMPNWKGGYDNKLARNSHRRALKAGNGGFHTSQEWIDLKVKYDFMCLCCKAKEPEIKLTKDHIVPVSMGGSDNISNLQPLCQRCNTSKWNRVINYSENITVDIRNKSTKI